MSALTIEDIKATAMEPVHDPPVVKIRSSLFFYIIIAIIVILVLFLITYGYSSRYTTANKIAWGDDLGIISFLTIIAILALSAAAFFTTTESSTLGLSLNGRMLFFLQIILILILAILVFRLSYYGAAALTVSLMFILTLLTIFWTWNCGLGARLGYIIYALWLFAAAYLIFTLKK